MTDHICYRKGCDKLALRRGPFGRWECWDHNYYAKPVGKKP